jgi:hypothetical protein
MMSDRHGSVTHRSERSAGYGAVPVGGILAAAGRAGRQDTWRILAVAVVVTTVSAGLEIVVDHYVNPDNVPLALTAGLSAEGVSLLGTVFLSGFLCRLIGQQHGRERATVGQVMRSLPWVRLVLADLLVVVLIVAGLLALVIPGLVLLNLLAVTGPVIEIEHRPVLAALRRSARLVRHHFWTVALLAAVPLVLASGIESISLEGSGAGPVLGEIAIRGIAAALVEAAIGLILVELCYRLIDLDARAPAAGQDEPGGGPDQALRREI